MAKKPAPKQPARKAPAKQTAKPKAKPRESKTFAADHPREFENGRRAAAANIPKDQAPAFFNDGEKKAWHEGYDSLG